MAEGTTAGGSGATGTGETDATAVDGPREAGGAAVDGTREAGGAAAGGGRWVDVAPDRLARWVTSFAERHGTITAEPGRRAVSLRAADGAAAECHPPFPPLPAPDGGAWPDDPADLAELIARHASMDRTVGVFLVRLGGFAAGVFTGSSPPRLVSSKVGSRLVHGRSAAGGTSQHRFAQRRENQSTAAIAAAADTAVKVLVPYAERLDAVVLGGDKKAMSGARADPRLRPVMKLAVERFLTVPDPKLAVLRDSPRLFLAVRIHLTGPP